MLIQEMIANCTLEDRAYGGNKAITGISENYIEYRYYFVFEGQITQPSTVMIGEIVIERNAYPLFCRELDNGHYDALMSVKAKNNCIIDDVSKYSPLKCNHLKAEK
jgi:hypothetical protein